MKDTKVALEGMQTAFYNHRKILNRIQTVFFEKLERKTGWGKNEVRELYKEAEIEALREVVEEILKDFTKKLKLSETPQIRSEYIRDIPKDYKLPEYKFHFPDPTTNKVYPLEDPEDQDQTPPF